MTLQFEDAAAYNLSKLRQSSAGQAKLRRYLTLLDPQPNEQILDLGCGSGEFCRLLVPHVGCTGRVTGVDVSIDSVKLATELSANFLPGSLIYAPGDGHCLDFEAASFDAAACISVLAFCRDPVRVLGELHRTLRPGGRLLLANSDDDSRFFNCRDRERGRRIERTIADRCLDPWAGRRLSFWLEQAGFTVVQEHIQAEFERRFDPGHAGYIMAHSMRDYVVNQTGVCADEYNRWLADLQACGQEGSYAYGVTSYAYVAVT